MRDGAIERRESFGALGCERQRGITREDLDRADDEAFCERGRTEVETCWEQEGTS